MSDPVLKQQILDDLDRLSPRLQRRALTLVHELTTARPEGRPIASLHRFFGRIDEQSAQEMERAIAEECERVNPDEW